jgi:hypothetical protein
LQGPLPPALPASSILNVACGSAITPMPSIYSISQICPTTGADAGCSLDVTIFSMMVCGASLSGSTWWRISEMNNSLSSTVMRACSA